MTDYNVGDKVTVNGEVFTINLFAESDRSGVWVKRESGADYLVPVGWITGKVPALPPEPVVERIVVAGCTYCKIGSDDWYDISRKEFRPWSEVAKRWRAYPNVSHLLVNPNKPAEVKAAGLVPVEDAAQWWEDLGFVRPAEVDAFRKMFGADDE